MSEPILKIGDKVFRKERTTAGCWSFCVPFSELGNMRLADIPPHSTVEIIGLPKSEAGHILYISATNGGDEGDYQYLSIYGGVEAAFSTRAEAERQTNRMRRAFLPLVESQLFSDPLFSIREIGAVFNGGLGFSTFPDQSDTVIRETIEPILAVFNSLAYPEFHIFICHASEDKSIAREFASFLRRQGAEVWLDQWEIKVGDSIVQKINDGLGAASHLAVLLSHNSVTKPWVAKEFSSALMR